jgi:hypothetical protein
MVVPTGTILYGQAIYTNTEDNPLNPNFPPQRVSAGEATTDEMMLFFFSYTAYQAGDENMVYDTTTYIHTYDNCNYTVIPTSAINELPTIKAVVFPNPTTGLLELDISGTSTCTGFISDITGKEIFSQNFKGGSNQLDITQLATGMYFITLADNTGSLKRQTLRVVKQ